MMAAMHSTRRAAWTFLPLLLVGCTSTRATRDREWIGDELAAASGHRHSPAELAGDDLPPDVDLAQAVREVARARLDRDGALVELARVAAGGPLFRLAPFLTPERDVLTGPERLDEAMKPLDLASRREEARTLLDDARLVLEAAALEHRRAAELEAGEVGTMKRLETAEIAEQRAAAAVPVHPGELASLDLEAPARISSAADPAGAHAFAAQPVPTPLATTPGVQTIDLLYEFRAEDAAHRPGEGHLARLPMAETSDALVVPWSALLWDATGATWVYAVEEGTAFRRRGVLVRRREGDLAVLQRGPEPGVAVVAVGAVELFGTEYGTGK